MKKTLFSWFIISLSFTLGITVVWLGITFWGKTWLKVIIILLLGAEIGESTYHYKRTFQGMRDHYRKIKELTKKIKALKIKRSKISLKKILIFFGKVLLVIINYSTPIAIFSYLLLPVSRDTKDLTNYYLVLTFASGTTAVLIMINYTIVMWMNIKELNGLYKKLGFKKESSDLGITARCGIWGCAWHLNILVLAYCALLLVLYIIQRIIIWILFSTQAILTAILAIGKAFSYIGKKIENAIWSSVLIFGIVMLIVNLAWGVISGILIIVGSTILKKTNINVPFFFQGKANLGKRLTNFTKRK
jgi:hypothetical protein